MRQNVSQTIITNCLRNIFYFTYSLYNMSEKKKGGYYEEKTTSTSISVNISSDWL